MEPEPIFNPAPPPPPGGAVVPFPAADGPAPLALVNSFLAAQEAARDAEAAKKAAAAALVAALGPAPEGGQKTHQVGPYRVVVHVRTTRRLVPGADPAPVAAALAQRGGAPPFRLEEVPATTCWTVDWGAVDELRAAAPEWFAAHAAPLLEFKSAAPTVEVKL